MQPLLFSSLLFLQEEGEVYQCAAGISPVPG
jgi:hypothetical protein